MENRWPPDKVNTVSMPLARSRRAMSRPACTVWVEGASMLISGSLSTGLGYLRRQGFLMRRRSDASTARRRRSWARSRSSRPSTGRRHSRTRVRWIAIAWAIGAVVVLVVLVLMRYFTPWGRQFWRITARVLRRPREPSGVADARRVAVVGARSRCGSTCCSATRATTCTRRCRRRSRASPWATTRSNSSGIHGFWMSIAIFIAAGDLVHRAG